MSTDTKNANERLIDRIQAVLDLDLPRYDRYGAEDKAVLRYIQRQLSPESIEARADSQFDSGSVTHLHEVAKLRLGPYETTKEAADNA